MATYKLACTKSKTYRVNLILIKVQIIIHLNVALNILTNHGRFF